MKERTKSEKREEFEPERALEKVIRAGIAEYPFLPKAFTAINDKELIDILLMATNIARGMQIKSGGNQWVWLRAIENAPAASFANGNIREACKEARKGNDANREVEEGSK